MGLTQKELATRAGMAQQTLAALEREENRSTAKLIELASALEVRPEWLSHGRGPSRRIVEDRMPDGEESNLSAAPCVKRSVPLISWVAAGRDREMLMDDLSQSDEGRYVETTRHVSSASFALRIEGDSMSPTFPPGAIVVVDPDVEPRHGSYVVARFPDTNSATFKRLEFDGPDAYLRPINPEYRTIRINGNVEIVGVVRQLVQDFE